MSVLGSIDRQEEGSAWLISIKRILVTGEEAGFVKTLSRHLKREGLLVTKAFDYNDARRKVEYLNLRKTPFELLIIEEGTVPKTEVYELWRWIKGNHPETSVLLFSAVGSHEELDKTIRPDMDAHCRKPLTPKGMMDLIRTIDRHRRHTLQG